MSPQPLRHVVLHCRALSRPESFVVEADCRGTAGFEGTGYVDLNGTFVGVDLEEVEGNSTETDRFSGRRTSRRAEADYDAVIKVCSGQERPLPMECFDGLFKAMHRFGRNPTMRVGEAYALWPFLREAGTDDESRPSDSGEHKETPQGSPSAGSQDL
jgi:hypothetical protein